MADCNPRYVLYAQAHGWDPETMLERDKRFYPGGCMWGFIQWIQAAKQKCHDEHCQSPHTPTNGRGQQLSWGSGVGRGHCSDLVWLAEADHFLAYKTFTCEEAGCHKSGF